MGFTHKILPHYTYDDWLHWEGKWELIDGIPIAMSPAPVPLHQRVAGNLFVEFNAALKNTGCKKCKVYLPIDYRITDDTILEPDLLIVCGKIEKKYLDFPPALVVEILSPSTALRDRNTKFDIYQQQGVKYYLIVDSAKQTVEVYEHSNGEYQLKSVDNDFTFYLEEGCAITTAFSEIWD